MNVRPTRIFAALQFKGPVAVVVALALTLAGCAGSRFGSAASQDPASVAPSLGNGLTEDQAIDAAREYLSLLDQAAPVWATEAGSYEQVFDSLAHRPNYVEQPPPAGPDQLDDPVWGIQFRVSIEICAPSGGTCETRDGLRTVLIDYVTGEKLRMTAYAPSPGEPLPTPQPATD